MMRKDDHLIYEAFQDNLTKTKQALGGHIMSIVKYGIPSKEEFIKIRQELHDKVNEIKARGTPATEEERLRGQEIIAKIKNYRSQHPNDPPPYEGEENAEDMSKSPFHYDPMHGLASAAHKIRDELRSAANDEARPEHIEKMAEIILGPQSAYASVNHYEKALSGVIELLNHYVNVPMNEYEEMPSKDFDKLKQHINKGPIKVKKPSKELPYTHNYIHHLAKQDPREDHKEENAEKYVYTDIEVAFNIGGNEYIAYGDVHFGEEGLHGKDEDTVENFTVIDAKTRQEVQDEGILKHGYNAVYNAGVNKSAEENQENDDEEGDLMTLMKQKGMIPRNADTSTGKYGQHREEEEGICIEDLAKKFGVELSKMQDELEKGIKVEMEHTNDFAVAAKIALDHLGEDPEYYIKLSKMEKSEGEERRLDSSCWKGYHKSGTKLKNGVRVNNCVKNS